MMLVTLLHIDVNVFVSVLHVLSPLVDYVCMASL